MGAKAFFKELKLELNKSRIAYLFMLPAILLVIMVSLYPILFAFNISLYETRYLERQKFLGLGHYLQLLSDPLVWQNIFTSLKFVFGSLILALPLGLILALLLNRPVRFVTVYRTLIIIPWIVSQTISALLWAWLLNPDFGPINFIIRSLQLEKIDFIANPNLAMVTLILTNVWRSYPFPTILLLAALQNVPLELYEAVKIDGGSAWSCFRYVTLPFITSTLLTTTIMLTLHYFNMFTLIYVLTGGGPLRVTEVLSVRVFKEAFSYWRIGSATALGIMIFICNAIFSLAYINIFRRETMY